MMDLPVATLAGPISGLPDGNWAAFHNAEQQLLKEGWVVYNPRAVALSWWALEEATRLGQHYRDGPLYQTLLRVTLGNVLKSDAVFVLEDWEQSFGANLEVHVARSLNIPVRQLNQILQEAMV